MKRVHEIDTTLGLIDGHGIAETRLSGLIEDIELGEFSLILSGWDFSDDGDAWATKQLANLAASWKEAA